MPASRKPKLDPGEAMRQQAAARQRRRRQRLREAQAQSVAVLLTKEQGTKLNALMASGYAPDKSSALAKGLDEAYEREMTRERKKIR